MITVFSSLEDMACGRQCPDFKVNAKGRALNLEMKGKISNKSRAVQRFHSV